MKPLTFQQKQAALALAAGVTLKDTAKKLGLSTSAISRWKAEVPGFKEAITQASADLSQEVIRKLSSHADLAVQAVVDCLQDPKTIWRDKLRAAEILLRENKYNLELQLVSRVEVLEEATGIANAIIETDDADRENREGAIAEQEEDESSPT